MVNQLWKCFSVNSVINCEVGFIIPKTILKQKLEVCWLTELVT